VLTGLAEQKPQLLQSLTERIFRRHRWFSTRVVKVSIGVSAHSPTSRCSSTRALHPSRLPVFVLAAWPIGAVPIDLRTLNPLAGIANNCATSHDDVYLLPLSTQPRQSLRTSKRHSNHVVPPRLPHLQQLPTLLPTRTSKWPPTSNHGRRSRRLCWLLEQPHWPQDRSLLVCRLRHFPGSNAPTRAHTNHYTGPPS
jgi:hypothetical protein